MPRTRTPEEKLALLSGDRQILAKKAKEFFDAQGTDLARAAQNQFEKAIFGVLGVRNIEQVSADGRMSEYKELARQARADAQDIWPRAQQIS